MDSLKIKIRCPSCGMDGKARPELIGRKVSCKHCSHVFRVHAIDDSGSDDRPSSPVASRPTASAPASDHRVEALEAELSSLRDEIASREAASAGRVREAEDRARDLERRLAEPRPDREGPLRREVESLRGRLDSVAEELLQARQEGAALEDELDRLRAASEAAARPSHDPAEVENLRLELDHARSATKAAEAQLMEVEGASLDAGRRHAEELAALRASVEDIEAESRAFEALRREYDSAIADRDRLRAERDGLGARASDADRLEAEIGAIRAELRDALIAAPETVVDPTDPPSREFDDLRAERDRLRAEVDALRLERETADAGAGEREAALCDQIARLEGDASETRQQAARDVAEARSRAEAGWLDERRGLEVELDRLRGEVDARSSEVEQVRRDLRNELDRLRADADARSSEAERVQHDLRNELDRLRAEADARAAELAEARGVVESGRAAWQGELDRLRAEASADIEEARADLGRLRTEADANRAENAALEGRLSQLREEIAAAQDEGEKARAALQAERAASQAERAAMQAEADAARAAVEGARAEAAGLADRLDRSEAELAQSLEEAERLRREAAEARPATLAPAAASATSAPVASEAEAEVAWQRAVDEAVKGAWADFERRLSETQAKLKAANARADLLEEQAREASVQVVAFQRGLELGDVSSFEDSQVSMTNVQIFKNRGAPALTWSNAEARLGLARRLAAERKDRALVDRIAKVGEKVRADIENRNLTLAETLVRGTEIEVGLDPGGWSIAGQRIFRPSPTIMDSLEALAPAFYRVMRQGDLAEIRSTTREIRAVLGDQAGLPEIRRPGRIPKVKRPIAEAEAARLFLAALEGENWLMRPILADRPPPETALTTYAGLVEACCLARDAVGRHRPDRLELLDRVLRASVGMLTRRQRPDGHFPFLDPRGKASRLASAVDGMVARQPDAVEDGWVVGVDPIGMAQVETGACGMALAEAGAAVGRPEWIEAARRAATWALGQPNLPNFSANAASLRLAAWAYRDGKKEEFAHGIVTRLVAGLFPGQAENGRWLDPSSALTANHLAILRALHDARDALPEGRDALLQELTACIDRAMGSLLAECSALGVPATGAGIRCLIRHRDQVAMAGGTILGRIEAAVLDSATVIQELCHDGPRPKLGVAPDLLAALVMC